MHPLIELASARPVNQISGFAAQIRQLDPTALAHHYRSLRGQAPRRHSVGKRYLVGHTGVTSTGSHTTRTEEHLAAALCNLTHPLSLPDGRRLEILDYQVPLKARRSDTGIGKIDLLGVVDRTSLAVVELKYLPAARSGLGDTPLRALLEALAYTAIAAANLDELTTEVASHLDQRPPGLETLVLANTEYWGAWAAKPSAGAWTTALNELTQGIAQELAVPIRYLALQVPGLELGLNQTKPQLRGTPIVQPVGALPS